MEERRGAGPVCELLAVRAGPGLAGVLEGASLGKVEECIFKNCTFGAQIQDILGGK